jgi:aminopeptidase
VLGIYEGETEGAYTLSKAAQSFQQNKAASLNDLVKLSGLADKKGKVRVFYGLDSEFSSVAVVSLGKAGVGYNAAEQIEEGKENVRIAVAAGVKQLQEAGVTAVSVDPCGDPQAAAEGACLCVYGFDELKAADKRKTPPEIQVYTDATDDASSVQQAFSRGRILAEGQNYARRLMETPANIMTPTRFCELAQEYLGSLNNVKIDIRERAWAEQMKMGSFLSVCNGSEEPPKFLEVTYSGGSAGDAPLAIVGKGITFDSGGISLKPSAAMDEMRADMGGAACSIAAIYTAARLQLPINIKGFMPLTENMPSGRATKPGDVVTAMNGKTIQIDNTDAEGRLVLCDALCYAETFKPRGILDMATLTGAMAVALGSACSGVFTNSETFWQDMQKAGTRSGDRVWRMPVFNHYTKGVTQCGLSDVNNIGDTRMGGSCTAAAFLKEFVTNDNWMHLDIAGVMKNSGEVPYLSKGMAGRPTRTIVEFMDKMANKK